MANNNKQPATDPAYMDTDVREYAQLYPALKEGTI